MRSRLHAPLHTSISWVYVVKHPLAVVRLRLSAAVWIFIQCDNWFHLFQATCKNSHWWGFIAATPEGWVEAAQMSQVFIVQYVNDDTGPTKTF